MIFNNSLSTVNSSLKVFFLSVFISSCGQEEIFHKNKTFEQIQKNNFLPQTKLFVNEGFITIKANTFFKKTPAQSFELKNSDKCRVSKNEKFFFSSIGQTVGAHYQVTLQNKIKGCAFQTGYFYAPHTFVGSQKLFYAKPLVKTYLKKKAALLSKLSSLEKCVLEPEKKYQLSTAPQDAKTAKHSKITLAKELANCSFKTGYVVTNDFEKLMENNTEEENTPAKEEDFSKTMKHILYWEGGCSDHPNDPGGRTYKGITTGRAKLNGWTEDVCTMPDTLIVDIYKRDYWNQRAQHYAWPLNLAVMNTEVNSGGGRAQEFLNRMNENSVSGSLVDKASWYVNQQTEYYQLIANKNEKLRVFLKGWLNRSQYMQEVISGIELKTFSSVESHTEVNHEPTGKAYENNLE
jgi:lysozyme family protein